MPHRVYQQTVEELLADESITIPDHQRAYVWDVKRAEKFIDTMMSDLPTHALFLRKAVVDGKMVSYLEDGHQRFMTVCKFYKSDTITYTGRKYSDLTDAEKMRILNYKFAIVEIRGITENQVTDLFQRLQDGKPLTHGQRFHARRSHAIVKLAERIMNDPRCKAVWGDKKDTKTNTHLANTVAIASGLAWGDPTAIANSYDIMSKVMLETNVIDEAIFEECLEKLLEVYRAADEIAPPTKKGERTKQWSAGLFTGYILYTMIQPTRDWVTDKKMWVDYIVNIRQNPPLPKQKKTDPLTLSIPASRNWTEERWANGLLAVEGREFERVSAADIDDDDEDDE